MFSSFFYGGFCGDIGKFGGDFWVLAVFWGEILAVIGGTLRGFRSFLDLFPPDFLGGIWGFLRFGDFGVP